MPVPTENLHNLGRLNKWFAVSCVALLASLIWAIWEDYDRPWREVQDNYMVVQGALAHLDYLDTHTEEYQAKLDGARKRLEQAKQQVAARADEKATIRAELAEIKGELDGVTIEYGNLDSIVQVTRNEYEVARGHYGEDSPEAKQAWAKLTAQEEDLTEARRKKEQLEDRQKALNERLDDINEVVSEAEKYLAGLERARQDARKKEEQYTDVLVKSVINMPLFDFTAPKGTPARHEIRQLVLPDVRQDLNYLESYTVDRCTTCHVAINDKAFLPENLARRLERALPAINEKIQREGGLNRSPEEQFERLVELFELDANERQAYRKHLDDLDNVDPLPAPPVPTFEGEEPPEPDPGEVTEFWPYLAHDKQDRYFEQLLALVNEYLSLAGRKQVKLEQPLLAHPNLDLFVGVESPHPMAKLGCTVCHEGNPPETDFVQAAHTPVNHEQEEEWKQEHYVTAAFVPNVTFETVEHHWDRPMLPPKYAEAGCAKCHSEISDITSFQGESQARKLNLGRDLFTRVGCINCHNVSDIGQKRKVGPDLTRVADKLDRGFAERWIFHPKKFRPSTWMPHLFLQENNGPGSATPSDPNPVLRTQTEVQAIAHYLYTLSRPFDPIPTPDGLEGDAERGRELFNEVGCLGCHANIAEHGRRMIVDDLQYRRGRSSRVAEALYDEMSYLDRAYYLMDNVPTDRDTAFAPETVGDRPVFTRVAPELSAIGSKVTREWLFSWLKDPPHYFPETRMPSLRLTDQEALDITEYLLTLHENETFDPTPFPTDAAHVEMADDLVFQLLSSQNSARRSRAIMQDENAELTRMLVKMLSDYFGGDEQTTAVINELDNRSKRMLYLGNKMVAHYGCYACHKIGGFETSPPPGTDLSLWGKKPLAQIDFGFFDTAHDELREARPDVFSHVYPQDAEELIRLAHGNNPRESVTHTRAAFALHKMLNPRIWDREKIKGPYDKLKMPNFYFTEQQADALVTYLVSRTSPRVNENLTIDYDGTLKGAIAEGRNLTRELNCVGCHKIEDNVATVHQYYMENIAGEMMLDEVNAPPWLRGEGAKVQFPWLYGFLNNVETLRPWLNIRMPSFQLTDDETTTLVQYFAGIARHESGVLRSHLDRIGAYQRRAGEAADASEDDAPDPELWFATDDLRDSAQYLADYAVKNRLVLVYDVDPNNSLEDLRWGFNQVLKTTRFTAQLFDVEFPFSESPRPMVADERYALGEEFFLEVECLACHVMGDPHVPGSNPNPSAPNLNLTHKRLRQEWVDKWLQEPAYIQPGTKMPQWFPNGRSAFAGYGEEKRRQYEGKYGETGRQQIELLMDYLYSAGVKNDTAVRPDEAAQAEDDPADDLADDEEYDDFEDEVVDEELEEEDE